MVDDPRAVSGYDRADWAQELSSGVAAANGQTIMLRQQITQLFEAVNQLYGAVSAQCVQLRDSDKQLLQELQRFQTGGPQRAMASVYFKLFRDLLKHMNHLDELTTTAAAAGESDWVKALAVERDHFQSILQEWGCVPMVVHVGKDQFDAEIHEAAGAASGGSEIINGVSRRGWMLAGTVIQYPLVSVG